MRLIINLVLVLISIALIYMVVESIAVPIRFKTMKDKREQAVIDKLMLIREVQNMYQDITGSYAPTWEQLKDTLTTGRFMYINIKGDPDDPSFKDFERDTSYSNASDSIRALGIDLAHIGNIPYTDNEMFNLYADTAEYQQVSVNVIEVGTQYKSFMGPYADPAFARYDNSYDPNKVIKFGDRTTPNTAGNWEKR